MQFSEIRSATSIVTFAGKRFLIDPMLSAKYQAFPAVPDTVQCAPANPTSDLPVEPSKLFKVDAVIATHLHFDHFDEEAKRLLPKDLPLFAQSEEEADELRRCGFKDLRVLSAQGTAFEGITLYRTTCDHGSSSLTTKRGYELLQMSDQACGVVFAADNESCRFYLAGDTLYCESVVNTIKEHRPGVIALNAAGAQYPLGHLIIMNHYDVLQLMRDFPDADVIATHLDGVSHASVSSAQLRRFKAEKNLVKLHIPAALETVSLQRGPLEL